MSVAISSEISGKEEKVCFISEGEKSDLVKKNVGLFGRVVGSGF